MIISGKSAALDEAINPKFKHKPMIISVALTGAVPDKSRYPSLPTEPVEIADAALECAELGASIVHLHMRDESGAHCHDQQRMLATVQMIRAQNQELVICATTTSRNSTSIDERLFSLNLPKQYLPDMLSLTLGSYNTPQGVNLNPRGEIEAISDRLKDAALPAEVEIFEPGMMYTYHRLLGQGKLSPAAIINILLGVDGASPATARELLHIVDLVPEETEWAVAGIGAFQQRTVWLAAVLGGNVRVGMEDDPRGDFQGWTNKDAVRRAVSASEAIGRPIATSEETRLRLGLDKKPK